MRCAHFMRMMMAVLVGLGSLAAAAEKRHKVLILGMDGTRLDAVRTAETPNLDRLITEGTFADTTQILGSRPTKNNTISGPGWSSILTGVWADKHGVMDNSFKGRNYDEYPHFFHYLKQARPEACAISVASWAPINKYLVSAADVVHTPPTGKPTADDPLAGVKDADVRTTKKTAELLADADPAAMFVYFHQVDSAGHRFGFHPSVPQYVTAIENVDRHIGEVLDALAERETYAQEDWLVLVTTDHGGKGTGHGGGHSVPEIRNTFLIVSGPSARVGKAARQTYMVDVAATALAHLGVPLKAEWKLDGRAVGLKAAAK
jgi:predicted AlkP superfamily pyrophosphatase or phosphodiesterase